MTEEDENPFEHHEDPGAEISTLLRVVGSTHGPLTSHVRTRVVEDGRIEFRFPENALDAAATVKVVGDKLVHVAQWFTMEE